MTSVQKNSYLKTNPHQKLRLKHYRNWIRWNLDDRDKTKWKQFCCQYRNIAVQRGSTTGTTVWPIVENLRLGVQKCREEISMAVLILAPVLKVL